MHASDPTDEPTEGAPQQSPVAPDRADEAQDPALAQAAKTDACGEDVASSGTGVTRNALRDLGFLEPDSSGWWKDRAWWLLIAMLLFLPFLGSFGLWDPWETHYGEVGRQITERRDWISTWWGSHWRGGDGTTEGAWFFSKPILLMWLMAGGLELFGSNEWGIRLGVALIAVLGVVLAYSMGASVYSRRVGWLMAGVLATSPFWSMLSRQAQTDMPFVGLLAVAMAFFLMGAFGQDRDRPATGLGYLLSLGWLLAVTVPQIVLLLVGLSRWRGSVVSGPLDALLNTPRHGVVLGGVVLGLGALLLAGSLWIALGGRDGLQRWARPMALGSFAVVWGPLLLILAGALVGAETALGGLTGWFNWGSTQAALYGTCLGGAVYLCLARPIVERRRLYLMNFYVFMGLATLAKGLLGFMLPGAILLVYILLTRHWSLLRQVELVRGTLVFAAVAFPWYAAMLIRHHPGFWNRFFVHDHFKRLASGVHQLTTGSFEHFARWLGYGLLPWMGWVPLAMARLFEGRRLEVDEDRGRATLVIAVWMVLAFTLFTLSSTKFHHYIFPVVPPLAMLVALAIDDALEASRRVSAIWMLFGAAILGLVAWDVVADPATLKNLFTYQYDREWDHARWTGGFRLWLIVVLTPVLAGALAQLVPAVRVRRMGLIAQFAGAVALTVFCLMHYMPTISATWSQSAVWGRYYSLCTQVPTPPGGDARKHYCQEPALGFKLNWRGETYYTANEVIPIRNDEDFEKFLGEHDLETPFFAIMERTRYTGDFQRKLPAALKGRSCRVHQDNLKFILAKVPCENPDVGEGG